MRDLRLRCILIVSAAVLLITVPAAAQGTGSSRDEIDSLTAKFFFVKKLDAKYPVSGFSGTWAILEEEAARLSGENEDDPAFAAVHQDVLLSWARVLEDRAKPTDALAKYKLLIKGYGPSAKGYREAAASAAKIHVGIARAATVDADKLANLEAARDLYVNALGDPRAAESIRSEIVDLKSREGIRQTKAEEFDSAFEKLTEIERVEGSLGTGEAAEALRFLREKTGVLAIRFLEIRAEGADVTKGAKLRFTPRGSGKATERDVKPRTRWLTGEYDISLVLRGESAPVLTMRTRLSADGTAVDLPNRVPAGMTYVPAGGRVTRPFFIDRTEVSGAAFRRFDPDYKAQRGDKPEYPARGIRWNEARAYASSVGKQLPTPDQWHRAAFGDTNLDYPWGKGDPKGRCNIGTAGPSAVDAYPNGVSPFGALNMAGNVWEWLRDGYAIGGGYRLGRLEFEFPGGDKVRFLHDKKPSQEVFNKLRGGEQRKFGRYRVTDSSLVEVGFRCVIEL